MFWQTRWSILAGTSDWTYHHIAKPLLLKNDSISVAEESMVGERPRGLQHGKGGRDPNVS
jgi:hypothetical protein